MGRTGLVTATSLNLRPSPSTAEPAITQLPRGDRLEILDRLGNWYRVRAAGGEGFVYADFVRLLDPTPVAGFLRDREDLRGIPLEPSPDRRLNAAAGLPPLQRVVSRAWNLQGGLVEAVGNVVEIPAAAAVAVLCVESGGQTSAPDGRMIIRFENHVFFQQWGKANPEPFHVHFYFDPEEPWRRHKFRERPAQDFADFHGDQSQEWRVLALARGLSEPAALRSISMGAPQIMGFNYARIGYDSVREMFEDFQSHPRFQILALFDFIKGPGATSPLLEALQRRRFDDFAALYNGPGQAAEYSARLQVHFEAFQGLRA